MADDYPKVSIAVLNYNGEKNLREFFPYVLSIDYPNKEIIIVDGGSCDGSLDYLSRYADIKVVDQGNVQGGSRAENVAMLCSSGEYVLLLGNDMAPNPDIVSLLLRIMKDDTNVAACGPKILTVSKDDVFTDVIDHVGLSLDRYCFPKPIGFGEHDNGQYDKIRESWWFGGCEALIRKTAYNEVGGFDESYVGLYEDVDFFWRLRLRGYKIALESKAVTYHDQPLVHATTTKRYTKATIRYYAERNRHRTAVKNFSTRALGALLPRYIALFLAEASFFLLIRRIDLFESDIKAFAHNLRDFRHLWKAHVSIQAKRVVADSEIIRSLYTRPYKLEIWRDLMLGLSAR